MNLLHLGEVLLGLGLDFFLASAAADANGYGGFLVSVDRLAANRALSIFSRGKFLQTS